VSGVLFSVVVCVGGGAVDCFTSIAAAAAVEVVVRSVARSSTDIHRYIQIDTSIETSGKPELAEARNQVSP